MPRSRTRRSRCLLLAAGLPVLQAAHAPAAAPPEPHGQTDAVPLSSLNRLLRLFDFEEAEQAPYTMPLKFYRYIAPDQGFPPFGTMRLTDAVRHGGRWSFEFELDGGSLSARVPTAVLPVLPGSDYTVSAWIRTDGLTRAAARLAARFHDMDGSPVSESQAYSRRIRTEGRWEQVSIVVYGDNRAADLVVELQVLQPRQFIGPEHHADEPLLEDITGRVWFDDVTIRQRPRIELSTGATGNVAADGRAPTLHAVIHDPTPESLTARLRIYDLDGAVVHDSHWPLPHGRWSTGIAPAGVELGWYRAVLEVANDRNIVGVGTLDFAVLAGNRRAGDARFGVALPPLPAGDRTDLIRHMTAHLAPGCAVVPLAQIATRADGEDVRQSVTDLLRRDVELTLSLSGTGAGGFDIANPPELLADDEDRHQLGQILMNFGLDVPRWRLGVPGVVAAVSPEALRRHVDNATARLGNFVPDPVVLLPWSAEYELSDVPAPHGHWVTVPYHVPAESIPAYAARWSIDARPLYVTFERLPEDHYPPRQRVIDLMLRTLHGWRAGLPRMVIRAPWSARGPRGATVPDPAYPVWRVLANQLRQRSFAGELPVAPGVQCWILDGPGPGETALVAWSERGEFGDSRPTLRMLLADGPVQVVDAFGNRRAVAVEDGVHTIPISARPIFVEGADGRLARFRADLGIHPSSVAARQQIHERTLRLANPWDVAISGTIRLHPPEGWRITPRIHPFVIGPGQDLELPISVSFNRGVVTGPATVEAEVELTAAREYRFRVQTDLAVSLDNIEFAAHWRVDRNAATGSDDLVITQQIMNTGAEPISVSVYVSGPGIRRQRRVIAALEPTQTAVRTFRVADGARLLAGKQLRVGVTEQGGTLRFNRVLEIPALLEGAPESVVGHDTD